MKWCEMIDFYNFRRLGYMKWCSDKGLLLPAPALKATLASRYCAVEWSLVSKCYFPLWQKIGQTQSFRVQSLFHSTWLEVEERLSLPWWLCDYSSVLSFLIATKSINKMTVMELWFHHRMWFFKSSLNLNTAEVLFIILKWGLFRKIIISHS